MRALLLLIGLTITGVAFAENRLVPLHMDGQIYYPYRSGPVTYYRTDVVQPDRGRYGYSRNYRRVNRTYDRHGSRPYYGSKRRR